MPFHARQLTATWLNIVAAGIASGGVSGQLAALASGGCSLGRSLATGLVCIGIGVVIHAAAILCARSGGQQPPSGSPPAERS